jgi:GNAT superfamily N-acetyltransferase
VTSVDLTAALLADVFPGARISRGDYLEWLYERSPFGTVIEANLDDELGRAGHYALVPIGLVSDGEAMDGALSLNTAVHERARGGGTFTRLAEAAYVEAGRRGIDAVVGVANANSTYGFVNRLGFELLTPLPATILLPAPGPHREVRSAWADSDPFAQGGPAADLEPLLEVPARGIARVWTPDTLRWRLAAPSARYALHRSGDALAISCRDQRKGVRVAILLKVFAAAEVPSATRRALVRAACRFHRAPMALHVGLNDRVRFRGVPLPERLREQPLNLIYRSLRGDTAEPAIVRFEFLDFDAY